MGSSLYSGHSAGAGGRLSGLDAAAYAIWKKLGFLASGQLGYGREVIIIWPLIMTFFQGIGIMV